MLTYPAGIKMYEETCRATLEKFTGFEVVYHNTTASTEKIVEGGLKGGEKSDIVNIIGTPSALERGVEKGEVVLAA
jgi:hypothetical protein